MIFHQNAFDKAKIKITLTAALGFLVALLGFFGCKKDIGQEPDNPLNAAVQDRSEVAPTVTNGMLHFVSFADLEAFTKSLQDKESDSVQVRSAYIALGVDVNAEYLPNLTDYPVCLLKEQSIGGYTSARKAEETIINIALDNGDDNVNSIVIFPFWKTALNVNRAVRIGNRIYKYYDNGGVAIVLNNDWSLYESIKTLPFESLQESFNLIVTSDAREGWDNYFTFNTEGAIQSDKMVFMPRFVASLTAEGKYAITNVSLVETKNGGNTFKWIYADNSFSFGNSPNKAIGLTETVTLVINNGDGKQETYTGTESILACSTDNFTITYLSNNQIRFELPGFVPGASSNLYNIRWVFSDGSTSTANPVVKTFTSNGTATCQLLHKTSGEVACQFTKPYFAKCGDKKSHFETHIFEQSNQRWKLDGSIWVQTGEVGCRVKYLRWRGAILKWQPANNQGACADLSGTYIREVYNPNKNCIDITALGSHCLGNGTWPTSVSHTIAEVPNVFSKPGQLSAGLGIKVNGTWRGWGYAGKPRLVLP
jgi:hypothetical protein